MQLARFAKMNEKQKKQQPRECFNDTIAHTHVHFTHTEEADRGERCSKRPKNVHMILLHLFSKDSTESDWDSQAARA